MDKKIVSKTQAKTKGQLEFFTTLERLLRSDLGSRYPKEAAEWIISLPENLFPEEILFSVPSRWSTENGIISWQGIRKSAELTLQCLQCVEELKSILGIITAEKVQKVEMDDLLDLTK